MKLSKSHIYGGSLTKQERSAISDFILSKKANRTEEQIKRDKLLSAHVRSLNYPTNDSQ